MCPIWKIEEHPHLVNRLPESQFPGLFEHVVHDVVVYMLNEDKESRVNADWVKRYLNWAYSTNQFPLAARRPQDAKNSERDAEEPESDDDEEDTDEGAEDDDDDDEHEGYRVQ